ncbi:MAG: hypothetical protein KBD24_02265 [Candidatus Pacebacteria bacterium]|nr:hypothetical protein [Candidatus Paceibacterota bacterium]
MFSPSRGHRSHPWYSYTARVLSLALVVWVTGLPTMFSYVYAEQLDTLTDTLSTSKPGVSANHTIAFETPTGVPADGSTIVITLPNGFDMSTIDEDDVDITDDGVDLTTAATCGAVQAAVSTSTQTITIEICNGGGGAVVANSVIVIEVGTQATASGSGTHQIVNHASVGSYELGITGTMADEGYTRLVILDSVTVSGAVDTYLEFTIDGVNAGGTVNQDAVALTGTSTATSVPFGTVQVAGGGYVVAQDLAVTTNAVNGFIVTVEASDDLRATNNATINSFTNGTGTATPIAWVGPSAITGSPDTYGHWGVTTEDNSLSDNDSFGNALYVGNFINNPREVMYSTSSADGATQHIGATRVGYKLQISVMQEAARDYRTTLTYVVTPTF